MVVVEVNGYEIEPGANLEGANLGQANLTKANLDGTNLTGAKLSGAWLGQASLEGQFHHRGLTENDIKLSADDAARLFKPDSTYTVELFEV